jgi:hypothetical protein
MQHNWAAAGCGMFTNNPKVKYWIEPNATLGRPDSEAHAYQGFKQQGIDLRASCHYSPILVWPSCPTILIWKVVPLDIHKPSLEET